MQGRGVDRRALAMLAVASGAILAWRAIPIAALRDPIAAWPWPGGDTWDFVAAGLELRGAPLNVAMRAPMLPLLVALGDASGLLGLVPLLGLVAACAAPVLLVREVAARAGGFAASAAALALLVSQTWLRFGLDWMADVPAAAMFALAAAALAPAEGSPRWIRAGILGGFATITSPLGLLLVPLAVGAVALVRPHGAEARRAAVGIALPLACTGAWFAATMVLVVAPNANVAYSSLLGLRREDLAPFLWQVLSGWGWPGSLAALVGLVVLGCRARVRPLELVPIAAVLTLTTFWGVVYGFHAPRFAATLLPLLVLPTALGLAAIPRRMLRAAAAFAVVLAAAWPLPGFVAHGVRLPIVPFPPLVVRVPLRWEMDGSVTPQLRAARLAREAPRIEDLAWIAARRPVPPPTTVVAGAFDDVAGVLLADAAPERRYERTRHLAALVRAPAVRASRLAIEVLPFGRPLPLGTRGPFAFTRVQNPLDGRDWILAVPAGEDPPQFRAGSRDADELERARAVAGRGAGRHVVAVVEPGASWWAWLCLLVPGDWLHYVVPEDLAGFETFLAGADRRGPVEQLHGLSLEPIESRGRVGIVVRAAPGG